MSIIDKWQQWEWNYILSNYMDKYDLLICQICRMSLDFAWLQLYPFPVYAYLIEAEWRIYASVN